MSEIVEALGNSAGTVLFLGAVMGLAWPIVYGMEMIARWRKW